MQAPGGQGERMGKGVVMASLLSPFLPFFPFSLISFLLRCFTGFFLIHSFFLLQYPFGHLFLPFFPSLFVFPPLFPSPVQI
ncbi:hypothetical protein C3F00_043465, partial [Pseudomonas sp. MWU13-2860]